MSRARSSVVRSFRLAGSLAAHQVVTSLIRARLSLAEARDTAQRQLAAEEKKKASKARPISFVLASELSTAPLAL